VRGRKKTAHQICIAKKKEKERNVCATRIFFSITGHKPHRVNSRDNTKQLTMWQQQQQQQIIVLCFPMIFALNKMISY